MITCVANKPDWLRTIKVKDCVVFPVEHKDTYLFLLNIHYAKRIPSISYSYGLFYDGCLIGVITYGTPSSAPLRAGVCGKSNSGKVIELNRLCCFDDAPPNSESFLVGRSLCLLPKPKIIVSFADTSMNHTGYIYQACNFIYTGLSAKRTDWKIRGQEHLHGATVADRSRGKPNRALYMRSLYGDDFYLAERPRKHRYIIFVGDKRFKKDMLAELRYPVQPYPKNGVGGTPKSISEK